MNAAARLAAYGTALALVFAAAWGTGAAVGAPGPAAPTGMTHSVNPALLSVPGATPAAPAAAAGAGLAATEAGWTLDVRPTTFTPGKPGELAFTVQDPDGATVTMYDGMRLAVVRRDAAGFQAPAPVLRPGGVWQAPLVLPAGGVYRLFAEFTPAGGPALVLGTDLFAAGDFTPVALPPTRVSLLGGYQVRLDGDLVAGQPSQVFATVSRDGAAVTDLEPQGDAFGDLVVLRRSDLSYTRAATGDGVPGPSDRSGPAIAFTADVPTAGEYRAYLTFRHAGTRHVAEFTLSTREGS